MDGYYRLTRWEQVMDTDFTSLTRSPELRISNGMFFPVATFAIRAADGMINAPHSLVILSTVYNNNRTARGWRGGVRSLSPARTAPNEA
jgi:hypothetical protein